MKDRVVWLGKPLPADVFFAELAKLKKAFDEGKLKFEEDDIRKDE